MFGKDLYYISILGKPSEKDPWMLQFGGHHLALNIMIAGERGVLTPTLTGAQPALYTSNGKTVRPLGQESDKAFALLNALDEGQRKQAILGLPSRRSCARSRAGRQNHPAGRTESFRNERAPTRHAARSDIRVGEHYSRKRGRSPHGRVESRYQRDLVRLERSNNRYSREETSPPIIESRGRISSSSMRRSSWAAIPPCMSIRCTATRRMTTDGGSQGNEDEVDCRGGDSAVARSACPRAQAGRVFASDDHLRGEGPCQGRYA